MSWRPLTPVSPERRMTLDHGVHAANSLRHSLRLRAKSNVEFDCQFVFYFHSASGDANGRDSKLFLLEGGTPTYLPFSLRTFTTTGRVTP
jgi:hypothetical protein